MTDMTPEELCEARRTAATSLRQSVMDEEPLDFAAAKAVYRAVGQNGQTYGSALADLIDPRTCRNNGDERKFVCSACGEKLYVAKDIPFVSGKVMYVPSFCPACGAEVWEPEQ